MLKDMQSIHAPGKTTKVSDVLAGEGKGNTGLSGLGSADASKYSKTERRDPFAFEGKDNAGLGTSDGSSLYGLTGKGPIAYIDKVER